MADEKESLRILFIGNSITRHTPKVEIGWPYDWGMAASSAEKDYVHLVMKKVREIKPDAEYMTIQVAGWEREYCEYDLDAADAAETGGDVVAETAAETAAKITTETAAITGLKMNKLEDSVPSGNAPTGKLLDSIISAAHGFKPDIVIMRIAENVKRDYLAQHPFQPHYDRLVEFLSHGGRASVIITTSFWPHPADEAIRETAAKRNLPLVELGGFGVKDEMKAIGLFEHKGVANHPGDKGMAAIADAIWKELAKIIVD